MQKAIILPDIHHPFHNKKAVRSVFEFTKWYKPDIVVLLGDALEMRAIDHWKKGRNKKYFEGVRLLDDYKRFTKDILEPIDKICPKARKVFMGGNHEDWVRQMINKFPQELEGVIDIDKSLNLQERGWEWIPFIDRKSRRGIMKLGKLTLTHGHYTNKYHASKTSDTYSKSVVYGHTHDRQLHTKVHIEDPNDFHSAESIGCLCDQSPEFLWGQPNRWVHSFGVVYIRDGGNYNMYVPVIIRGKFTYSGKTFGEK